MEYLSTESILKNGNVKKKRHECMIEYLQLKSMKE